ANPVDPRRVRDEQTPAVDERHGREVHLLLARERVGGGPAFDVHGAVGDHRQPVLRSHLHPLDGELTQSELLLEGVGDAYAEVDGVPGRFAIGVQEGERARGVTMADRDRAGRLDLVERALRLRPECGPGQHGERRQYHGYRAVHSLYGHSAVPPQVIGLRRSPLHPVANRPSIVTASSFEMAVDTRLTSFATVSGCRRLTF